MFSKMRNIILASYCPESILFIPIFQLLHSSYQRGREIAVRIFDKLYFIYFEAGIFMIFVENNSVLNNQKYFAREISKIVAIKGFQGNCSPRNSLTYSGLKIYYWWFCYTALVLTNLFIISVGPEIIGLKDEQKILRSYNLSDDYALYSTVPPVHERHILLKCFWRNNV